jgi:CDGSH-type Zn-finger protein
VATTNWTEADVGEERSEGRGGEALITPYRDGPYLVRGAFSLQDPDGDPIPVHRRTIALCRCGKSRTRPFCDGTHKVIDFRAPGAPESWPPEPAPQ